MLLLIAAFSATLPFALPLDLIADRWVFPRIEKQYGISVAALDVRYEFPATIVATQVSAGADGGGAVYTQLFDRLVVRPEWHALLGRPFGSVELYFADGKFTGRFEGTRIVFEMSDLKLQRFDFLANLTRWKLRGGLASKGTIELKGEGGRPEAELELSLDRLAAEGVNVLGMVFPEVRFGRIAGAVKYRGGRMEIAQVKSTGGNASLNLSGAVTMLAPLGRSTLSLLARIGLGPELLAEMKGAEAISLMKKEDGTIHIAMYGSMAEPNYEFR